MSDSKLQANLETLIGKAIIDPAFRKQLLTSPADIVDELSLNSEEREMILAIRANSLSEFAAELDKRTMEKQQEGVSTK